MIENLQSYIEYRVAWLRNGMIIKTKCLSTHPNWMNERKTSLGSKRLNEIFIPGTHDSGAYYKDENHKFETVVDKYTITQVRIKLRYSTNWTSEYKKFKSNE